MVAQLNFQPLEDRAPPHNIDAEEAVLGGILLDSEGFSRVAELISPESFYVVAHRQIYMAAADLHNNMQPTDLMNVTTWLQNRSLLEKVGGQNKLVQLVDRTVSAVNIDQYALLIQEKHTRRRIITTGHEIVLLGYKTHIEVEDTLDQCEQKMFAVAQEQRSSTLVPSSEILAESFDSLVDRSKGLSLPGITCGFYDLDAMTGGFQRSDLIIVAGRPSMGKTSFVLNVARNIAGLHKLPVAVFSLEMSKDQLMQRMLSTEARVSSQKLRSGQRILPQEWEQVGHGIAHLSALPIFIDDSPNISVNEIRSAARKLQAEQGGALGAIVIDYLQLMEGSGKERVQVLSKITRALKGLARELNVPVLALSQLSRNVEGRTDKRPMMADLRESGSIEQDSDLVLMLYRPEYYDKNTEDRGIAEVIISKHRNGPVGTVKLLFEPEFTQFRNLANR